MGQSASLPENVFYSPVNQRTSPNDRHIEDTKIQQVAYSPDKRETYHKLRHSSRLPSGLDTSGDVKNITMPKKLASKRRDYDPRPSGDERTHHRCRRVSEKDDETTHKRTLQQAHANYTQEKKTTHWNSDHDAYQVPTRDTPNHRHKQVPRGSYVVQHASDGFNVYKCDEKRIQKECFSTPFMKQEEQMREEAMNKTMKRKPRKRTVNVEGIEYEKKKSHHQLMKELLKPECSPSYNDALARYSRVESERRCMHNVDIERKKTQFETKIVSRSAAEKRCGLRTDIERRKEDVGEKKLVKKEVKSDAVARYASLVELERRRDAREAYADMNASPLVKKTMCTAPITVNNSSRGEMERRRESRQKNEQKKNEALFVKDSTNKATVEVIFPAKVESEKRRDVPNSFVDIPRLPYVNGAESSKRQDVPNSFVDIPRPPFVNDAERSKRRDVPNSFVDMPRPPFVNDAASSVLEVRYPSRVELERRKAASNEESFLKRAVMQSDSVGGYASLVALERRRDTGDCCADVIVTEGVDHPNEANTNFTYSSERVERAKVKQQGSEKRSDVKLKKSRSREIVEEKTKESKVSAEVDFLYEARSRTRPSIIDTRTIDSSNEPRSSTIITLPNEYETKYTPNSSMIDRASPKTSINDLERKTKLNPSPNSVPNIKFSSPAEPGLCQNKVASAQGLFNSNPIVMTCQVDVKEQRYNTLHRMGISKIVPPSRLWRCSGHSIPAPQPPATTHESCQQVHEEGDDDEEECEPYIDELCSKSVRSKNKMFEILASKFKPHVLQTRFFGYPVVQVPAAAEPLECHHRQKQQQVRIQRRPTAPPVFTPWDRGMIPHNRPRNTAAVEDPPERRAAVHDTKPVPKKETPQDHPWHSRPDNKLDPERVTRFERAFRNSMRWRAVASCDNRHHGGVCTFCGERKGKRNECSICSPHESKQQKRVAEDKGDKVQRDLSKVRTKFYCKPASHFYQPIVEEGQLNLPAKREHTWGCYERERRQERLCKGATGREKHCECRGRERKYEPEESDSEIECADSASNYDPYFKDSQKALFRNARAGWNERDQMVARQELSRRPRCGKRPIGCRRFAESEASSAQSRYKGRVTRKPLRGILKRCGCRYGDRCGAD